MKKALFSIIIFLSTISGYSQSRNVIDSISALLKKDKQDTIRVIHLNKLSTQYANTGSYDTARTYSNEALSLAKKLDYKKGIASSLNIIGMVYFNMNNYTQALNYYTQALSEYQLINDKNGIASSFMGIGNTYNALSDYPKALDNYFNSLKINDELHNNQGIADISGNIGLVYQSLSEYEKSLDYFLKALKLYEELNDKQGTANTLGNIGLTYQLLGDYKKSLEYQLKSLEIEKSMNDKHGIAGSLGNIGLVYYYLGDYTKSLSYFMDALSIQKELNDKQGIASSMDNISGIYLVQHNYFLSIKYAEEAQRMSKEIGNLYIESDCENTLYNIYKTSGDNAKALTHYEKYIVLRDSIFKVDNQKEIVRKEMNYQFDKKQSIAKIEQDKKDEVAASEKRRQTAALIFMIVGLISVIVFSGFVFKSLRTTKKQKEIIEGQKQIVEDHQKEVTDSINYAKRIQTAILTPDNYLNKHLKEHFILYTPKDIVSGDFYWGHKTDEGFVLATGDCTGHGVSGSLMSMIGASKLNEIVIGEKISRPSEVLDRLREEVINSLNPEGATEEAKDGMDVSVCRFDLKNMVMEYAGANNSIYLVRDKKLIEFKADKFPVGIHTGETKPFNNNFISIQNGDCIYSFTDGYADQFGGEKGKKFKYKQMEELLASISHLPMDEQKSYLDHAMNQWRGKLDQVDDILIAGIRI